VVPSVQFGEDKCEPLVSPGWGNGETILVVASWPAVRSLRGFFPRPCKMNSSIFVGVKYMCDP
jgi:hypothetical protein